MEFSIELHTMKSGWSIIYCTHIEGSHVILEKKCISFSEDPVCLRNSADPD